MSIAETLGETGGFQTAIEPGSQHPRENGGVFDPPQSADREANSPPNIRVVEHLDLTDEPIGELDEEVEIIAELDLSDEEPKIYEAHGEVAVGLGTTHYKAFFPEERNHNGIGYLFHGYMGFLKSSEPYGRALARAGLANVVVDQSHLSASAYEDITDAQALHVATAEAVFSDLGHNREITHKMPDGQQAVEEQWLVSAHSMGGLGSTRFVEAHPDEAETLALLKTVGVNKPILLHIIKSALDGTAVGAGRHELIPYLKSGEIELNWKNVARMARYLGVGWPIMNDRRPTRAIGEGLSCLFANTRESLSTIGDQGTKRIGIEAGRDPLVAFAFDFKAYVDKYVLFPKYGHLMPQVRADLTAQAVLSAREDLRFEEQQNNAA